MQTGAPTGCRNVDSEVVLVSGFPMNPALRVTTHPYTTAIIKLKLSSNTGHNVD